jgi:hypothetical protein
MSVALSAGHHNGSRLLAKQVASPAFSFSMQSICDRFAHAMFGLIREEAGKLVRTPGRWKELFRPRRWRQFFGILLFNAKAGNRWKTAGDGLKQREYESYEQYVRHQQSKLAHLDLAEYDRNYRQVLTERLRGLPAVKPEAQVICLGARQGTEVKAFRDLGCSAIGVDLNPGPDNPLVVYGDFHNLQYPVASMDILFTNSMDHAFDMEKMLGEVARVLKPGGLFVVEAMKGGEKEGGPDQYASLWWNSTDDLVALLKRRGFTLARRAPFSQPWPGEQLCFLAKS